MSAEGADAVFWSLGKEGEGLGTQPICPNVPEQITPAWVRNLAENLERATWKGPTAIAAIFPKEHVLEILQRAHKVVMKEPTLVEVKPS